MQPALRNYLPRSPTFREANPTRCRKLLSRGITTLNTDDILTLRRSYLYVPSSSDRMLEKTKSSPSDVFIYDLEDSISPVPADKANARARLRGFLSVGWFPVISRHAQNNNLYRRTQFRTGNELVCAWMISAHPISKRIWRPLYDPLIFPSSPIYWLCRLDIPPECNQSYPPKDSLVRRPRPRLWARSRDIPKNRQGNAIEYYTQYWERTRNDGPWKNCELEVESWDADGW